jgi:hypothetical protein
MVCRIANFTVEFKNPSAAFKKKFAEYAVDAVPQATFELTEEALEELRCKFDHPMDRYQLEGAFFYNNFIDFVAANNTLFFHASLIEACGQGIAFTALSGTGKTTHTFLWQQLLGDKMQIINGDKPIIRFDDDGTPYGYGAPWCGKENLGKNTRVPLRHICFIERGENNTCEQITAKEALNMGIFNQFAIPRNQNGAVTTLSLIDQLLKNCTIWKIKCNMDISAAQVAYNAIFGSEQNEA